MASRMTPFLALAVILVLVFHVHLAIKGQCHHRHKQTSSSSLMERFVVQRLQNSDATKWTATSKWWSSWMTTSPFFKQPQQHRALGPGQKEIAQMAEGDDEASTLTNRDAFGPAADFTCTTKGAVDYVSCVKTADGKERTACSWCPLGGGYGVCVGQAQAVAINHMESWHVKCDPPGPMEDEEGIEFWAQAAECSKFNLQECLNGQDGNECNWCESSSSDDSEPAIQFCTSQQLWNELKEKQHSDAEGHINVDQVFSCRSESRDADEKATSLLDTTCSRGEVHTLDDNRQCTATLDQDGVNCTIATNPFPGLFMGATGGPHCVSESQFQVLQWIVGVLTDMGWELEGSGQSG